MGKVKEYCCPFCKGSGKILRGEHPMKGKIKPSTEIKIREYARIMIENQCTMDVGSFIAGCSPAYFHSCVSIKLKKVDPELYKQVHEIIQYNSEQRYVRAAEASKRKRGKKNGEV